MNSLLRRLGLVPPDLSSLPATIEPGRFHILVFAGVLGFALAVLIFAMAENTGTDVSPVVAWSASLILFAVVLRFGSRRLFSVTLDSTAVVARRRGETLWTEPLDAYEGVMWREETRGTGKHRATYQIVELRHRDDESKTIEIYEARRMKGVRATWEAAARALGIQALRETAEGVERRNADELDMSVRDRVRAGLTEAKFDPNAPKGIIWTQSEGGLSVDIRPDGVRRTVLAMFGAAFAAIMSVALFGFAIETAPAELAIGTASVALALGGFLFELRWALRVTPSDLVVELVIGGGIRVRRKSFPLAGIEGVNVASGLGLGDQAVRLESDRGEAKIALLDAAGADWLRHFIRSAIAEAPD